MEEKPFELISIDYTERQDRIRSFVKAVDVDFPVLLDTDGKISAQWNVVVFPSTFH
jgi:peroxiredoxin